MTALGLQAYSVLGSIAREPTGAAASPPFIAPFIVGRAGGRPVAAAAGTTAATTGALDTMLALGATPVDSLPGGGSVKPAVFSTEIFDSTQRPKHICSSSAMLCAVESARSIGRARESSARFLSSYHYRYL